MATDMRDIAVRTEHLPALDDEALAAAEMHMLATGDLGRLDNKMRIAVYRWRCLQLGITDPFARPFDWLVLDGKLTLYENAKCAAMLKNAHHISIKVLRRADVGLDTDDPMTMCEVEGRKPNGQTDQAIKYVPLTARDRSGKEYRLRGKAWADAQHKAETGAKRRLVFSMVGVASGPAPEELQNVKYVVVDGTGQVIENPTDQQRALAADPKMARVIGEPVYEDADAASPFGGTPFPGLDQADLEPPKQPAGPRPSFKPSEDDIKRWCGAWFSIVRDTYLDNDDERHAFVRDWTAKLGWPPRKQTNSLRVMFARMTEDEAQAVLQHVRQLASADRARMLDDAAAAEDEPPSDDVEPF